MKGEDVKDKKQPKLNKKRKSSSAVANANAEEDSSAAKKAKKPPKRIKDKTKVKNRKKNNKKNKKDASNGADSHETVGQNKAVRYLDAWVAQKDGGDASEGWKFNKCRQILLLQHCYDKRWIGDDKFDNLLCYIDSIRGDKVRQSVRGNSACLHT